MLTIIMIAVVAAEQVFYRCDHDGNYHMIIWSYDHDHYHNDGDHDDHDEDDHDEHNKDYHYDNYDGDDYDHAEDGHHDTYVDIW